MNPIIIPDKVAPIEGSLATNIQVGEKIMNIDRVDTVNNITNNILTFGLTGPIFNATNVISMAYYNLFVANGDIMVDPFFLIEKDRAITTSEGVSPEISTRYALLTPEAIDEIKTFPSILATKNRKQGCTDSDHLAMFGFVTDVQIQEVDIKVFFQRLCSIPQQKLNEIALDLAIQCASFSNEFDRTHWAIKRMDLVEKLRAAGMKLPLPT